MSTQDRPPEQGKYLTSFQKKLLQTKLKETDLSPKYRQRISIMLLADEGKSQSQICKILKCSPVTVRHWTIFASSGQAHNWQSTPLGRPKSVNEKYRERLKELINKSPQEVNVPGKDYKYRSSKWTAKKLGEHLAKELGIKISDRHVRRLLKDMGLSTKDRGNRSEGSDSKKDRILIKDLDNSKSSDINKFLPFNPINFS